MSSGVQFYPAGVKAAYNSIGRTVKVTWSPVSSDNIAGYVVYRKDSAKTALEPQMISGEMLITDTLFNDTLPETIFESSDTVVLKYQVKSVTVREDRSQFSFPAFARVYKSTGGNNQDGDTLFADTVNGDFTLSAQSPCVNSGENTLLPGHVSTDLSGNARVSGGVVDMGAFERQ